MGNTCESICNPNSSESPTQDGRISSKGKYARVQDKDLLELVKKSNTDTNQFFRDDIWWKKEETGFLSPEKFDFLYNNYKEDQLALENLWKPIVFDDLMKKDFKRKKNEALIYKWKYIIRKGVPFSKMRILVLEMFGKTFENNDLEYESAVKVIFQEQLPTSFKNTATFADEDKIEDVIKVNFLNEKGLYTLKKILWIFRKSIVKLEYSPMLPQVLALLLLFLTEAETFTVTKLMIEESVRLLDESQQYAAEEMKGLRWHLTLNREDFEKFIKTFYKYVKIKSKAFNLIEKHLTAINYDYVELFSDWFKNLFFGFLPLPVIIRIFVTYLNEGIKIYYRMGYALLRTFKKEVLNHTDPETLTALLRDKANNIKPDQIKKMMKKAYALPLSSLDSRFSKVEVQVENANTNIYYLPHVGSPSAIINNEQFETLWEWLPKEYKLSDPIQTYSSAKDGWSLKTLYAKTDAYQGYCMIILIKSDKNTIFGAFIDQTFNPNSTGLKYTGTNECFVFQLSPKDVQFKCSGLNNDHLVCASDYISIGNGGDGPAIYLDGELLNGQTYRCDTYKNFMLNGKTEKSEAQFKCMALEVYVFN